MMPRSVTPEMLARIDAWFVAWSKPRKRLAAELGIAETTLMDAALRKGAYRRIAKGVSA